MSERAENSLPSEDGDPPSVSQPPPFTRQFKYERMEMPTNEQLIQAEVMNTCIARAVMAGIGGLFLGGAFGIVMGAMDTSSMDSTLSLDPKKQKTTLQVLRETAIMTKNRSVYVPE